MTKHLFQQPLHKLINPVSYGVPLGRGLERFTHSCVLNGGADDAAYCENLVSKFRRTECVIDCGRLMKGRRSEVCSELRVVVPGTNGWVRTLYQPGLHPGTVSERVSLVGPGSNISESSTHY